MLVLTSCLNLIICGDCLIVFSFFSPKVMHVVQLYRTSLICIPNQSGLHFVLELFYGSCSFCFRIFLAPSLGLVGVSFLIDLSESQRRGVCVDLEYRQSSFFEKNFYLLIFTLSVAITDPSITHHHQIGSKHISTWSHIYSLEMYILGWSYVYIESLDWSKRCFL